MYADLGPGQTIELDEPSPTGVDLLYGHTYVFDRMRTRMRRSPCNRSQPEIVNWSSRNLENRRHDHHVAHRAIAV
jgi:hypothetical protein